MNKIALFQVPQLIMFLLFSNCRIKASKNRLSCFAEVVQSNTFVDKSLLLKEIFDEKAVKIVSAPRKFGKSTNLDMIKRFLEIEVDNNGLPIDVAKTSNFKLFKDNNLLIFQETEFFNQHCGKYPVVYIDYSPLREIENFEDFLNKFSKVLVETFLQHKYLLKNKTLWLNNSELNLFESYASGLVKNDRLSVSLNWLCELLHRNFGKKVFILADECDAAIQDMVFNENDNLFEISKLLRETDGNLFKYNNHSIGAFLTGVLRVYRGDCDDNVWNYVFLEDHEFSPFYGITEAELNDLLDKLEQESKKISWARNNIDEYYSSYRLYILSGKLKIYNTWAVTNYLKTNEHVAPYLCRPEYLNTFKKMCKANEISEWIRDLLSGKKVSHVYVETRQQVFTRKYILALNFLSKYKIVDRTKVVPGIFLTLLYYLGYLTPADSKLRHFTFPNKAIHDELISYIPDEPIDPFADPENPLLSESEQDSESKKSSERH